MVVVGMTMLAVFAWAIIDYFHAAADRPRPGDTIVTGVLWIRAEQREQPTTVVVMLANPGRVPVLVGLSARRDLTPAWFGARAKTRAVWFTGRSRYRAGSQSAIGVVCSGATSRLPVQVPGGRRRLRVVALVGETDGRLRVITVRIATRPPETTVRLDTDMPANLFPWLM